MFWVGACAGMAQVLFLLAFWVWIASREPVENCHCKWCDARREIAARKRREGLRVDPLDT